ERDGMAGPLGFSGACPGSTECRPGLFGGMTMTVMFRFKARYTEISAGSVEVMFADADAIDLPADDLRHAVQQAVEGWLIDFNAPHDVLKYGGAGVLQV